MARLLMARPVFSCFQLPISKSRHLTPSLPHFNWGQSSPMGLEQLDIAIEIWLPSFDFFMKVAADGETPAMKFTISRRVPCLVRTISATLGHASGTKNHLGTRLRCERAKQRK